MANNISYSLWSFHSCKRNYHSEPSCFSYDPSDSYSQPSKDDSTPILACSSTTLMKTFPFGYLFHANCGAILVLINCIFYSLAQAGAAHLYEQKLNVGTEQFSEDGLSTVASTVL